MIRFIPDAESPTIYAFNILTGKRVGIRSLRDKGLIERVVNNDGVDKMLVAELDIVSSYLSVIA